MRVIDFALPDEKASMMVYRFLREKILTEENSDAGIGFLLSIVKIRWIPFAGKIIEKVLDQLFPQVLLRLIRFLILRTHLATEEDFRKLDSPFERPS